MKPVFPIYKDKHLHLLVSHPGLGKDCWIPVAQLSMVSLASERWLPMSPTAFMTAQMSLPPEY